MHSILYKIKRVNLTYNKTSLIRYFSHQNKWIKLERHNTHLINQAHRIHYNQILSLSHHLNPSLILIPFQCLNRLITLQFNQEVPVFVRVIQKRIFSPWLIPIRIHPIFKAQSVPKVFQKKVPILTPPRILIQAILISSL